MIDLDKIPRTNSENRILRVIFDADLRCSHDGLTKIAKGLRVSLNLKIGEFVVFINHKKNMLKIFAAGNTVAHFKMPNNRRMDLKVIAMIPRFFNGKELKYDDAMKELIYKKFGAKDESTQKNTH